MSEKRFPPSERRLAEARRAGDVAVSPVLVRAAALVGGVGALLVIAPALWARLVSLTVHAFTPGAEPALVGGEAFATLRAAVLPVAAATLAACALAAAAQTRGHFSVGALAPGAPRGRAREGALRSLLVGGAVLLAALLVLRGERAAWADLTSPVAVDRIARAAALAGRVALRVSLATLAVGAADFVVRSLAWRGRLWMTRDEVEQERRQDEGDPRLRAERRRQHRTLGQGLAAQVARARVVVAGAVGAAALGVDGDQLIVTCSGERLVAARIVDLARRVGLPVRSDETLAALLARATPGPLPAELAARARAILAAATR